MMLLVGNNKTTADAFLCVLVHASVHAARSSSYCVTKLEFRFPQCNRPGLDHDDDTYMTQTDNVCRPNKIHVTYMPRLIPDPFSHLEVSPLI